jgi:hypothetical protein
MIINLYGLSICVNPIYRYKLSGIPNAFYSYSINIPRLIKLEQYNDLHVVIYMPNCIFVILNDLYIA